MRKERILCILWREWNLCWTRVIVLTRITAGFATEVLGQFYHNAFWYTVWALWVFVFIWSCLWGNGHWKSISSVLLIGTYLCANLVQIVVLAPYPTLSVIVRINSARSRSRPKRDFLKLNGLFIIFFSCPIDFIHGSLCYNNLDKEKIHLTSIVLKDAVPLVRPCSIQIPQQLPWKLCFTIWAHLIYLTATVNDKNRFLLQVYTVNSIDDVEAIENLNDGAWLECAKQRV